ncbi:MAG: hypothetical protein ACHQ0J_11885 [Candidatus Dormibacterales bacterium]
MALLIQMKSTRWGPLATWFALVLYVVLAFAVFSTAWIDPGASWLGDNKDPKLFIWYLGWIPHELAAGRNPLITDYLSYPPGVNLMWNSSILLPALLLWPVTSLAGPVVSYNLLITASVALSAWLGYLAARRFVSSVPACFFAGSLYGFSPGIMAQATGHPHALIALLPPIVLILGHEILVLQRRSPVLLGVLAGVAAALQLLTGEEVLATTALIAAIGIAVLAALHPKAVKEKAPYAARAAVIATLTFAFLAAYPLGVQFLGPQRVSGNVQSPDVYVTDLLSLVVPNHVLLQNSITAQIAGHLAGNRTEDDAYLGVALLVLFGIGAVAGWRRTAIRWATLMTVAIIVLSFGPHLHFFGRATPIPLPWAAIGWMPLIGSALPSRLMLAAFLGAGIVIATLWEPGRLVGRGRRIAAAVLLVAGLVMVFPAVPATSTGAQAPDFFRAGGAVGRISPGTVILVTPFSSRQSTDAMYWQTLAGFRFRMPEGDAFTPGPFLGPHPTHLQASLDALDQGRAVPVTDEERRLARADLASLGVRSIVAGPSPGHDAIVRYLTAVTGSSPTLTEGVDVWWSLSPSGP